MLLLDDVRQLVRQQAAARGRAWLKRAMTEDHVGANRVSLRIHASRRISRT